MDMLEIMKKEEAYCSDHRDMPGELQKKAKMLCWRYIRPVRRRGMCGQRSCGSFWERATL